MQQVPAAFILYLLFLSQLICNPYVNNIGMKYRLDTCLDIMIILCFVLLFFSRQMYISLISFHALILVAFHFVFCFEEDWTST